MAGRNKNILEELNTVESQVQGKGKRSFSSLSISSVRSISAFVLTHPGQACVFLHL